MPDQLPPITEVDFPDDFADFEPEMREQAVEIANELQRERPEDSRKAIVKEALRRAKHWWMDRAG